MTENLSPTFASILQSADVQIAPVIKTESKKIIPVDFSHRNKELEKIDFQNTAALSAFMNQLLAAHGAEYGAGGYKELRTIYSRSNLFNHDPGVVHKPEEPRRLHMGTDIWGAAGTPVFAPLDGTVHSFAFNNQFGDYGATLILKHTISNELFHTLYGHISLDDLKPLKVGMSISAGEKIAHFGTEPENGNWPPHLHFQIIRDMQGYKGDYPGVCRLSERAFYIHNCPDPELLLNLRQFMG